MKKLITVVLVTLLGMTSVKAEQGKALETTAMTNMVTAMCDNSNAPADQCVMAFHAIIRMAFYAGKATASCQSTVANESCNEIQSSVAHKDLMRWVDKQ